MTANPIAATVVVGVGMNTSNHVYVLSDEYSWIPARLLHVDDSKDDSSITADSVSVSIPQYKDEQLIQSDGGINVLRYIEKTIYLKDYPNNQLPLQNVTEDGKLQVVNDMVDLSFLHEVCC